MCLMKPEIIRSQLRDALMKQDKLETIQEWRNALADRAWAYKKYDLVDDFLFFLTDGECKRLHEVYVEGDEPLPNPQSAGRVE